MKKKLGTVLLVVALALSFGLVAAPSVGANSVTGVGPMAVAPSGSIFAAVYDGTSWMVQKSNYGGHSWKETALTDAGGPIAQIVVSPNYRKDRTVYVAVYDPPTVYSLEEAGDDVVAFPTIPGATELYSIDVWTDEDDYNWILAATDIDVFAIEDRPFGDWFDQEFNKAAYEVAFAPDCGFGSTYLIWAITESDDGDFLITSTVSPGKWGQDISDVEIDIEASPWVDLDFPEEYDSDPDFGNTILFAALSSDDGGGVYRIDGVEAPDASVATMLMNDEDIVSLAVSDDIILAGALSSPSIYRSVDGGENWSAANRQPTGECWTHVYLSPDDFFPPMSQLAYASTFGDEGGVFCSNNLGFTWRLVSCKLFG